MRTPRSWRAKGDEHGFDELFVAAFGLHIEAMDHRTLDVHFGDVHLTVWRERSGEIRVRLIDGTVLGLAEP